MIRCVHGRGAQTSARDCGWNPGGGSFEDDRGSLRLEAKPEDGILGCCSCSMGREDHEENRWRISAVTQNLGLGELDTKELGGMFRGGLVAVRCAPRDKILFACDSGATEQGRRVSTSATARYGQMRGPCRRHTELRVSWPVLARNRGTPARFA